MTDFWENHFNIYAAKGAPEPYYLVDFDQNVVRPHALGKFRDLLGAVAKSPAMLFYLDNAQSMADSMHPVLQGSGRGQGRAPIFRPGVLARRPGIGRLPVIRPGDTAMSQPPAVAQQRRARGLNENYARELMELHTLGVDGGYTQKDVIEVARALTGWTIRQPRAGDGGVFVFRPE